MNILLDVDTQVDFMMSHGALYVSEAEKIVGNIRKLMTKLYMPIISTVDEHDVDDEEFKIFPKHCVRCTSGAWKIPETMVYETPYIQGVNEVAYDKDIICSRAKQFIITKKTYNIWDEKLGNPYAMKQLLDFFLPETVHVVGVATDISVLAAVRGLSERVERIVLHKNCIKGLTKEKEENAIKEMVDLGNVFVYDEI